MDALLGEAISQHGTACRDEVSDERPDSRQPTADSRASNTTIPRPRLTPPHHVTMSSPNPHTSGSTSGFPGMSELPPLPSSSSLSLPPPGPASSLPASPLLLFNKYTLLRKLGSGSFGDIYLGFNTHTGGHVAVKLEAQDMRWKQLCFESRLYSYLQGKPGQPVHEHSRSVRYQHTADSEMHCLSLTRPVGGPRQCRRACH